MPSSTPVLALPYPLSGDPAAPHLDIKLLAEAVETLVMKRSPLGAVTAFAGSAAPEGWLLCAGQAVSRSTYAGLYAAIGDTYGAGDGTTTFNLPDLRGRVMVGLDNMGGVDAGRLDVANTLGGSGGAQTHTLVSGEMPTHTHVLTVNSNTTGVTAATVSAGAHVHGVNSGTGATASSGAHTHTIDGVGDHSHGTPEFVAGQDNRQINTTSGTSYRLGFNGSSGTYGAGSHSHSMQPAGAHTHTVSIDSGGAHTHTVTITDGGHAHTATAANAGSGTAHNNMQPYMLLNMIIRAL